MPIKAMFVGLMLLLGLVVAPYRGASAGTAEDRDFYFRLGLMEGHLIVAHDLIKARKANLALPHFGHPVRELYDDVSGYLKQKNFPGFNRQLAGLEAAAAAAPYGQDLETRYQATLATLAKAKELVPSGLRDSLPDRLQICADTMDAAAGEYAAAIQRGKLALLVEYHDSRGFITYVGRELSALATKGESELLARFNAVYARTQAVVGRLIPDPTPVVTVAQFREFAGQAAQVAKPD